MGKFVSVCAAAVLALSAATPAVAETAVPTNDVRCLVVGFQMMSAAKDDAMKNAALVASMYYFGKLDGGAPGLDLEAALIAQIDAMKKDDLQAEGQRCGNEMQGRGKALEAVGDALTKKGY